MADVHTPCLNSKDEERKYHNSVACTPKYKTMNELSHEDIKIDSTFSQKTYKTLDRINEAKRNANLYSDQVIKQYQFNKDDEDEEMNFLELCDALNSHL